MKLDRRELFGLGIGAAATLGVGQAHAAQNQETPWPPPLNNAKNGTVTLQSERFLEIPENVAKLSREEGAAAFTVAKHAPTVELAYHGNLGTNAVGRRLWSSWGDICVAGDGKVYSGIGDHGDDVGGDARCFIYRWDPKAKSLEQVVDMNRVIPPQKGQPAWSKVHAKIDEGTDNKIYFSCTLNDGNRAILPAYRWNNNIPGGQLYQYDPANGRTTVAANMPNGRCSATSILDRQRNVWWCNLEGGGNALWGLDLTTKKPVFQGPDGSVVFNRAFALARDGSIYFNGESASIMKYDAAKRTISKTRSAFTGKSPGMRSASLEARDGSIYGTSHATGLLFRYRPAKDELTTFGPAWMKGDYTTVCILSPDERFLYYLPGAHGGAFRHGTPVVQYDIANNRRKVLAFLAPAFEQTHNYVPAGTYGAKLSTDGATLFVNFNGHPGEKARPKNMKPIGFGLCSFAAIHIPREER